MHTTSHRSDAQHVRSLWSAALSASNKGGDLAVYDDEDLCTTYRMEPDAYTTSCMVFFKGFNYGLEAVEGGSKLALIYRLVQRSVGPLPVFQDTRDAEYTILQAAQEWEAEKLLPKRAIHMLDHEYEYYGGLSGGIADLIGRDQAVAKALMNVHWTGLQLYIAFITKAVSGTATHTDVSWTADRWQDLDDGCLVGLESVDINAAEIMQGEDWFAGVKPDCEDESTTGHYAPTRNIRRKWRRAALVLWPRCHSHQLLCDSGQAPAITVLNNKTYSAVWRRRKLTRAAAQLTSVNAVELAAAMAAAAEAAVSDPRDLQQARTFAEAVWTRYSTNLFTPSESPHERFVHLIHELGMDKLALKIADKLKETEEECNARWEVASLRSVLNKPTHGLCYPRPKGAPHYYQKLALTPSTAKELSLLAELVGWSPYLPIMLDMASKPDDLIIETEEECNARWEVASLRSVLNKPTHGLCYPRPKGAPHYYQKLALTPSTAKELSLLAELVGWSPYLPIMLDMASKPDDLIIEHCTLGSAVGNYDLRRTYGGFKALRFLSRKAHGLGGQPLADVLPQMAASVAQTCLHRNKHLFATGASACKSSVQAGYQRFVAGIAFIIADLTKHVAEAGKSELKAVHDSFVEVYMKQPEDYCFAFFHDVIVPVCVSLAGSSKLKGKLAGCPVLQSLMQACIARLEELTRSAPQKPKDWALDVRVECDAKEGTHAADELCMNCSRLQEFLQDAARTVFTATLSRAEAQHLQGVRWKVRDARFKQEEAPRCKQNMTFTKVHTAYEEALAKHNRYLSKLAALKSASIL
ncbi:hypothetical protein ABBQ32_000765 [Trebouxia sp. C0010 RCD-2024]